MIICLDAGHSINGAVGSRGQGHKEEVETRRIVAFLERKFKALGHDVVICSIDNESNANTQLKRIIAKENSVNADLFISIHLNAYKDGLANGVETYSYFNHGTGHDYAVKVQNELIKLGYTNRGKKQANFYVLRCSKAPAILVECGFITSPKDMQIYDPEKIADKIVYAITGKVANSDTTIYRVVAGSYSNKENAEKMRDELKMKGIDAFLTVK